MKSILDPSFRYYKSVETDLKRTFARVRREMAAQKPEPPKPDPKIVTIRRKA